MSDWHFDIDPSNDGAPDRDGHPDHPYDWSDITVSSVAYSPGDNFLIRGGRTNVANVAIASFATGVNIKAWDLDLYGPWTLDFQDLAGAIISFFTNPTAAQNSVSDFIITHEPGVSPQYVGGVGFGAGVGTKYIRNGIIYLSHPGSQISFGTNSVPGLNSTSELRGLRIQGGAYVAGYYSASFPMGPPHGVSTVNAKDCAFNGPIGGTNTVCSILNFTNSAINTSMVGGGVDISFGAGAQPAWTGASLPAPGSPKEDYDVSTINAGITAVLSTPPYTGYEDDLWGNPRTDIGTGYMAETATTTTVAPTTTAAPTTLPPTTTSGPTTTAAPGDPDNITVSIDDFCVPFEINKIKMPKLG